MARIRSIKPEFWTSEQIVECSRDARLLFIGLWNFCDDGGVHPVSIKRIKMEIFPGDDLTRAEIENLFDELISNDLIEEFEAQGDMYWHVVSWDKHQKIDRPSFKYPKFADHSSNVRRALDEHSPPEGNGTDTDVEGKGTDSRSSKPFSSKSAFAPLTSERLADPAQVLEWVDDQQKKKRPVVGNSEAEIINVLGAAYQVTISNAAHNPPAVFAGIVSKRRWGDVTLASIDAAREQLRAIRNRGRPPPEVAFAAAGIAPLAFSLSLDSPNDLDCYDEADGAR